MRYVIIAVLCLVAVSTREFSRHLTSDHVHDHDYPYESRTARREDRNNDNLEKIHLPTGPIDHIAHAQALKMNQLENQLEKLNLEVNNLNNEDEDIKGALNFLRIVKGNGCDKKQFQCLRNPEQVPQCISHHSVCDGVKDCRDGDDEDSSVCVNLTPVGSSWGGDLQWSGCASHRSSRLYVVITRARPDPYMQSYLHVTATLVFTWVENGRTMSNTEQADGHFCYGSRALKLRASIGAHVGADLKCTFTNDVHCHGELFKASTGTVCSRVILNRQ